MLKNKSKILFCIFLIITLISTISLATDEITTTAAPDSEEILTTEPTGEDETSNWKNEDLYLFQEDIVIDGVVDGNVFAFGTNVTVTGEIGGDLFVFANNLNIDGGYIYSSIFAFANDIKVNGIVYDVYAACNNFTLEADGYVYRDLKLATTGDVTINGKIRRNAFISSDNIKFSELADTYIGGNLNYSASNEISIPENAVSGDVNYSKAKEAEKPSIGSVIAGKVTDLILTMVNALVVSLLAIWLTPKFIKKVSNTKVSTCAISLAVGLGALIGIPVVSIILMVTVVGIPLAFALLALYFLVIAFSTAFSSLVLAGFATRKFKLEGKVKYVLTVVASSVIIWLLSLIPFIGGLIAFLNVLLGMGTVVINLFRKVPTEEENK